MFRQACVRKLGSFFKLLLSGREFLFLTLVVKSIIFVQAKAEPMTIRQDAEEMNFAASCC